MTATIILPEKEKTALVNLSHWVILLFSTGIWSHVLNQEGMVLKEE